MRYLSLPIFLLLSALTLTAAPRQLSDNVTAVVAQGKVTPLGHLAADRQLRLAIGLPLHDAPGLTNLLREIYNPASPLYHHYLTPQQFTERFGPTPADYAAVEHFAATNGLTVVHKHSNRLALDVTGRVRDVERAFHVRLNSYRHPKENRIFYASDAEPTIDGVLPILHISGLDDYSLPQPQVTILNKPAAKNAHAYGGTAPSGAYFGGDFRQAYVPGTPLTGAGQNIGLLQFDGFYPDDITNYANATGMTNIPGVVVINVDGGVASPGDGDLEVSLDIEMAMSMAPGISNIYVYEAPPFAPWLDILSQMAEDNLASQLSSSWGSFVGPDPAAEQVFLEMAAQGQTFFNASGDSDAYSGAIPFPCDSPNATIVGGTLLNTDDSGNYVSENVWNRYDGQGSGGGISTFIPIPPWQVGVDMTAAQGSTSMRNIPDVAMIAENVYVYYNDGTPTYVGGTSCGAPLWAGLAALMNQQAAQLGQPPVGFLNPAIYSLCLGTNYSVAFHDITTGDNTSFSSLTNFFAAPGYDLCTGWGTPNGTNLINELTILDFLQVAPQKLFASGVADNPLAQPDWTLALTNTGTTNLCWALGPLPPWLTASITNGVLCAGGTTNLTLLPAGIPPFSAGNYFFPIEVTNLSLGRIETVAFQLCLGNSLVVNGDFETTDFSGWTLNGNTFIGENLYNVVGTDNEYMNLNDIVHSGNFGVFLGEGGGVASLSQVLSTVPGQTYQLSFWLNNVQSGTTQLFFVSWGNTNLLALVNPPSFGWTNYQFTVTALDTNTLLEFNEENDPFGFGFDDVSVLPVPLIASATVQTNSLQLTWGALAGLNYNVQFTTNLDSPNWQNLSSVLATTNECSLTDTNFPAADHMFFRLQLIQP